MKQGSRVVIGTYWAQRNPQKLLLARWANHVEQKLPICCYPFQHHFPPQRKVPMTLNPLVKAAIGEHGVCRSVLKFFFLVVSLGCFPSHADTHHQDYYVFRRQGIRTNLPLVSWGRGSSNPKVCP